ncbi:multicopper oxidase domain-containing protein [Streptomyces tendae]|uniref:multicopper oxidase domain-containing protein n=1 Tax=Streptomyces tendae TaxID=1932 RepID=UPI00371902AF
MTAEHNRPGQPTGGRYPSSFGQSGVRARHLRAHIVVAAWLALAVSAAAAQQSLPVARWLAVHLFLLGAATTAVVVWSEHFAVALLHTELPDQRWSATRLAGVNIAVAGVLTGVWADLPVLTGAACALLVTAVTAHLVVLVRMGRGALGGRLAPIAGFYRAAAVALIAGVVLGWLLADGRVAPASYAGVRLAHLHVTLLGWIGLPVLGTLFMLWPTTLGVPMAGRTPRVARRVLALTGAGLLVAVIGLGAGWRAVAVGGVGLYGAGVALAAGLLARTARGPRPVSVAAVWSLGAAGGWLCAGVVADAAILTVRPLADAGEGVTALLLPLLLGFVAQVLIGALTYLLPIVLGGEPERRAALRATLEVGWPARLVALNAGAALSALPLPGPAVTVGAVLAVLAGAAFLMLIVGALTRGALTRGARSDGRQRPSRRPVLVGTAAGAVLTVLAVLVANSGGDTAGPSVAAGRGGAAAATTRTVEVTLADMRVRPGRIEVTEGTDLRLKVTNQDAQRHDLKVADGPATPLLTRGQSRFLDLGPVTGDRQAWCTLPGHRAAGMTLDIVVGAKAEKADGADGHDGHAAVAGGGTGPDLSGAFTDGWRSRDAVLPPAPDGRLHRVTLRAAHTDVEVAPGTKQQMWTFGGTAPGPTLRGKVGDVFEVTLVNDDHGMGHGIDFHAGSLAPDGPMRTLRPGERLVYRFRAEKAGAWLYHCSTAPMLQHIGNGMYGAVVIDPPGLEKADREYLLVSSELYLGTPGSAAQVAKMRQGAPDLWAFNGIAAQYVEEPLRAAAGERARFWVVAAGPNDGVAFHVVGTVFDTVYKEGAQLLTPDEAGGAQVLDLAPAQGGFVETVFPEAGHYSFVDHDMRHAESGAHGVVEVR